MEMTLTNAQSCHNKEEILEGKVTMDDIKIPWYPVVPNLWSGQNPKHSLWILSLSGSTSLLLRRRFMENRRHWIWEWKNNFMLLVSRPHCTCSCPVWCAAGGVLVIYSVFRAGETLLNSNWTQSTQFQKLL